MKKKVKNKTFHAMMSFLIILFCSTSFTRTYQTDLSFDSLFPMTWYQKGLESSLSVWQMLCTIFEKNNGEVLPFDVLLGRLAFAQFCVNCMYQEDVSLIIFDDSVYFSTVLEKIQQLLMVVMVTPVTQDFLLCAYDIIASMQKKLNVKQ